MQKLLTLALAISAAVYAAPSDFHIPYEKIKLKNGMRVILSRDPAVPVVSIYVAYDVGARSEEKGRTGFAHLFEHMMFEGSANVKKGEHMKYVQSNGGTMNGSTHPDYTDFYESLPSNKLALGLWLESDRMRNLAITAENLKNQQEAVKQERRLRFDNQPYTTAIAETWPALAFGNFQSAHSVIGSFDDLNAASVEDVAKFFKTYYAPNNAVLVIAGDFETAEAKKLVEQYFGDIPSQPVPARPDLTEPVRNEGKMQTVTDTHARVPAVVVGWPAPNRHTADWYALNMMDAVLTTGQSSRVQLDLMKGKQSLLQVLSNLGWPNQSPNDFKGPGFYSALLLYKPNFTAAQIVDQFQAEIDRIAKDGVDAKELERVKAVLRYDKAGSLQTTAGKAQTLGVYEILDGNPDMFEQDFEKWMNVTSAQMQDAIKKYLTPARRDVLAIQPAPAPQAPGAPK